MRTIKIKVVDDNEPTLQHLRAEPGWSGNVCNLRDYRGARRHP
jgi:hypothetical protein